MQEGEKIVILLDDDFLITKSKIVDIREKKNIIK